MILVDTSVWVDHFRAGLPDLVLALNEGTVLMHPFVLGEVACGNLKDRRRVLGLLAWLPQAPVCDDHEVLEFIERRAMMGRGIGYIDAHLLASVVLAGSPLLWTRDSRLNLIAQELDVGYLEQG